MPVLNEPFRDNVFDQLLAEPLVDDSDPDLPPPPDGDRPSGQDDNGAVPAGAVSVGGSADGTRDDPSSDHYEVDEVVYELPVDDGDPDLPPPPDGDRPSGQDDNDAVPAGVVAVDGSADGTRDDPSSDHYEVDEVVYELPVDDGDPDLPPPPDGDSAGGHQQGGGEIILVDLIGLSADSFEFATLEPSRSDAANAEPMPVAVQLSEPSVEMPAYDTANDLWFDNVHDTGESFYEAAADFDFFV